MDQQIGRHLTPNKRLDLDGNPIVKKNKKGKFEKIIENQETELIEENLIAAFRELKIEKINELGQKFEPFMVAAGGIHSAIVFRPKDSNNRNDIIVFMGNNDAGQCGPDHFKGIIPFNNRCNVQCGENHTLIRTNRRLITFGSNQYGQLGRKTKTGALSCSSLVELDTPNNIHQISTKANFNLALDIKGRIWGWGCNQSQIFKFVTDSVTLPEPTILFNKLHRDLFSSKPIELRAGTEAGIVLTEFGQVYTFGKGFLGFSTSDRNELYSPIPISINPAFFNFRKIVQVYAGDGSFGARTDEGDVYVWGRDGLHIGLGERRIQPFPVRLPLLNFITDCSFGHDHTLLATLLD